MFQAQKRARPENKVEGSAQAQYASCALESETSQEGGTESIFALQATRGNQAALAEMRSQAAPLYGSENLLGARIDVSPDLIGMLGGDDVGSSQPGLPDRHTYDYQKIEGEAFVQGANDAQAVDPNDVKQGELADCYLLAAMAAIARSNPQAIQDLISSNGDGTYDVTLYVLKHFWSFSLSPVVVTVDGSFPSAADGSGATYAKPGDQGANGPELWCMLIEKAFATREGGYDEIEYGNAGKAMEMLTGGAARTFNTHGLSEEKISTIIDAAFSSNMAITASSRNKDELSDDEKAEADEAGVVTNHAYAVQTADLNAKTVSLQNPWGVQDLAGLPVSTFKKFYSTFQVL